MKTYKEAKDNLIVVTQNGGKVTNKDRQNALQKSVFKDPPGTRQDEYVKEATSPKPDHPWRKSTPKSPKNKGLYKKDQPGQLTRTPRKSTGKKLDKYMKYLGNTTESVEINERGMDVGHQRSQAQKHLAAYTKALQSKNYVMAQKHYQKYILHKNTLQKAKKTV